MSKNMYQEAWNYALEELHNQYISEDRENEFIFNYFTAILFSAKY